MNISNRPTFLGLPFRGETAEELRASLQLRGRGDNHYGLFWGPEHRETVLTIEPGKTHHLRLFGWKNGTRGYCVFDQTGDPIVRFDDRELKMEIRLADRLGRSTILPIKVVFDDSHLKAPPQLLIVTPIDIRTRLAMLKSGLQQIRRAFQFRR